MNNPSQLFFALLLVALIAGFIVFAVAVDRQACGEDKQVEVYRP